MTLPSFLFNIRLGSDLVYDIEVYPNIFTVIFYDPVTGQSWYFEISEWQNDIVALCLFIEECRVSNWVGFNNLYYDYPVVHFIYQNRKACITYVDIYNKSMSIIDGPYGSISHVIWSDNQLVPQVDLFKIHHFDNRAKSTGLKVLEFNMRSARVENLPFEPGTILTKEQAEKLTWYNGIDIKETTRFLGYSLAAIEMRRDLMGKFPLDMMNCSDVKIGEKLLIHAIEGQGITTTIKVDGRNKKLQTDRTEIAFRDVIFSYVKLEHPQFRFIYDKLQTTVLKAAEIKEELKESTSTKLTTKGVFADLVANIDGVKYKFGTGGLHGSVESRIIRSDNEYQIVDVDVASYYPNLGIKNSLYPEHLGREFCLAYEDVYQTRKSYPKGTPENEAYKLALNGSYGNSNNSYSALFDPKYTMAITINGQLLLAMLIEQMIKIPNLKMIQANTDGITYLCPRWALDHTLKVIDWWENLTKLQLEEVHYDSMFIRDVNSYIAMKEGGKVKRIGAYAYETADKNPGTRELPWHKDWSFRIVAMAAEAVLVYKLDLRKFIMGHEDVYDFFGRTKVPKSAKLLWGGEVIPNIVRYYISTDGKKLEKLMPAHGMSGEFKRANKLTDKYFDTVMKEIGPGVWDERVHTKNKSVYAERLIGINTGWDANLVNDISIWKSVEVESGGLDPIDLYSDDINYEFYIKETEKLINLMEG